MENRLKTYQLTREGDAATSASGLTTAAAPVTFEANLDLQQNSSRLSAQDGILATTGSFTAFTYDSNVIVGDRIYSTPFGALRVESVYPWDDEDPTHYEVGLVPA